MRHAVLMTDGQSFVNGSCGPYNVLIDRARAAFDAGDKKQAAKALDAVVAVAEFASKDLQNEWHTLSKKAGRARH